MKAIKGVYRNGQVLLSEPPPAADPGPTDVLVVFPEESDDPWQRLLEDVRPRPALSKLADELLDEMACGQTEPLNPDKL